MNFHLENALVEIVLPFVDSNGNAITPEEITATLIDGEGQEIIDFGSIPFDAGATEVKVLIPSQGNVLQGDDLQEIRRLEFTITQNGHQHRRAQVYAIEAEQSLQIMRNSFQTYDTALLGARSFVNLTALVGDTQARQRAALSEAYRRITTLSFIYTIADVDGNVESTHRIDDNTWHLVTEDVWRTQLPSHFKRALRAAQLAEADELLQGNVVARKHAQGIASETIGESSVTFREGFGGATTNSVGSGALALLSGYIDTSVRIGRA